jgi:hypothetical protein
MAAIGMMCCMNTVESFEGASLRERIYVLDNSFVGNDHGITGGANVIAVNNLFAGTKRIALKRLTGSSIAAHNLFFSNGSDSLDSLVDDATTVRADPLLDAGHRPKPGSPAIDAGTAFFEWNSEVVLNRRPGDYRGLAPDLGAFESPRSTEIAGPWHCGPGAELALLVAPMLSLTGRLAAGKARRS